MEVNLVYDFFSKVINYQIENSLPFSVLNSNSHKELNGHTEL